MNIGLINIVHHVGTNFFSESFLKKKNASGLVILKFHYSFVSLSNTGERGVNKLYFQLCRNPHHVLLCTYM